MSAINFYLIFKHSAHFTTNSNQSKFSSFWISLFFIRIHIDWNAFDIRTVHILTSIQFIFISVISFWDQISLCNIRVKIDPNFFTSKFIQSNFFTSFNVIKNPTKINLSMQENPFINQSSVCIKIDSFFLFFSFSLLCNNLQEFFTHKKNYPKNKCLRCNFYL